MKRLLLFNLGCCLLTSTALAQYEVKGGNFNGTFMAGPPVVANPPATSGQFASVGQTTGAAGPIGPTAPLYAEPAITVYANRYPATATKSFVLVRASIGGNFASGLPRYNMGDEILPPLVNASGAAFTSTLADATAREAEILAQARLFWRPKPVLPGENVNGQTPQPLGSVTVTSATVNTATVTVDSVPSALVLGATILGQPVARILGNTITLAGNANTTITSSTAVDIIPSTSFYYSPHSEKVYASQPGRVNITWVTRVPNGSGNYELLAEEFAVSSTTTRAVRTIYWTEGGFDGPKVQITDSRITTVSPAYYNLVPKAVPEEVTIPGYTPATPNLTTLSFQRYNGVGQLSAYNVEGRVLVEYLGNVRAVGNVHESIGSDVVNLVRVPLTYNPTVHLGKEITPHNGDTTLTPSPVLASVQNGASYYGTVPRANGTAAYYAERETGDPKNPDDGEPVSTDAFNKVAFYWLEEADFSIKWPKFQNRYWLRWSPQLSDYAHYTVDSAGSTAATGVPFTGGTLPQIVYQDDPAQEEARIDLPTQRLTVTFADGADKRNRSLLKFNSGSKVWYVNLYTQAEGREEELDSIFTTEGGRIIVTVPSTAGLEVGMVVTGSGVNGRIERIIDGTRYEISGTLPSMPGIANPSFELDPVPGFPGYITGITGWTYVGNGNFGLNTSAGPFAPGFTAPHGSKVAFIQGVGTLQTTVTHLNAGQSYSLSLSLNRRPGADPSPTARLSVDGVIFPAKTIPLGDYRTETVTFTASATTALVKVESLGSAGDDALILDNLIVRPAASLSHSVESDDAAPINDTTAIVGTRLTPPAGHENAGYISDGTGYYPAGYLNPFVVGVSAANLGAIIPVNALPTDNVLKVRWFKKIKAPSVEFQDLYVPGKWGSYTVSYPGTTTPQIVIAEGVGTGDLPPAEANGSVYYQNDVTQPGFNPNEEHALMLGGRAYALREDLNVTSGDDYTSQPFVLVAYTNPVDHRPAIHAYKVVRTVDTGTLGIEDQPGDILFDYPATAGTLLVKPYPLPLMPLATVGTGVNRTAKDLEITPVPDLPANASVNRPYTKSDAVPIDPDLAYKQFTFQDRKGLTWVHRGPHDTGSATLTMKLYYLSRVGFFVPGTASGEIPVDTVLPFLRNGTRSGENLNLTAIENGQDDEPLTIVYRPTWPTDAPELRVGETLTLPKFGLPQVRGQKSAQVYYEQSIANALTATLKTKNSVTLHDPTREKTVALKGFGTDNLLLQPAAIKTSSYQGKTYFQLLPPHLQQRIYLDPLRGAKGTLVLIGTFHDEPAGDDYLDLNLLTAAEEALLKGLVPAGNADKSEWDEAINALSTRVETFMPDPAQFGSYIVDTAQNKDVGENELARITDANTAVDSYAVTATGRGTGFVTMVFGNGNAFTPEGDPVQVQVFKVASQLYVGDLKVVTSSNPLDEQVTLRHSGDFAGKPEDYDFEWRWATGLASAPLTYSTIMTKHVGDPTATPTPTNNWIVVSDPGALRPTDTQYTAAGAPLAFTPARTVNVRPVKYELDHQGQPTSTVINVEPFDFTPSALNGTTVTVASTASIKAGMQVTGASISGAARVDRVLNATQIQLSQSPSSLGALTFDGRSYMDDDIAAGFPGLVVKSTVGVDFSTGVPGSIVFSADLGTRDGFVLYVNGRVALAHNAPTPQFTHTGASAGLTTDGLSRQFSVEPSYFSPITNNTIEVAIYTTADANAQSALSFLLEAAQETDLVDAAVTPGTQWQTPAAGDTNIAIVGGNPSNPFGGPQFVLNDRWFTVRYKPKAGTNNVLGSTTWSRWMPPQFVEGWVKRVLAAINPFEQRVKDLYNNQVSTDVSVLTQAGTRWEGDVALTLDNINDVGLIAIYETVLNRAKNMSIDANTNDPDTNNALILAAGYLNDLYTILGNEAYADAANPTISLDDQTSITEVNTSRFSFEGQVASSLDEELALLRGRDDSVSPGVINAPAYNRLVWNYTHGINSGEAIYAVNYNIKEKVGSSTADGVIDEADAQRMFPQGHGDAYGHYLTALTGYYRLLTNANFTWTPRAEAVTVLGQPVTVDFQDERKFAAAAGNVARTAQQVVALVYRQSYKDDPAAGWDHYSDSTPVNTATNVKSAQGLDEWASRAGQGALFHWAVANALVPDVDTYHTGVQKIDRTTVPEITELTTAAISFQTTMDDANAHLNPLGLSPGAVAFDLSPAELQSGTSHFEQVYGRSLRALLNASGAFNRAAVMTRSLRNQQNQLDDYNTVIVQQERAYVNQLIDIYGRPYSGDIGPGKLYAQSYVGPDLYHWFIVDRPNELKQTEKTEDISIVEASEVNSFTDNVVSDILADFKTPNIKSTTITVQPSQWVQYNDVWKAGGLGSRAETGALQEALNDAQQTWLALADYDSSYGDAIKSLKHQARLFQEALDYHATVSSATESTQTTILALKSLVLALMTTADVTEAIGEHIKDQGDAAAEYLPKILGALATDSTSAGRGAVKTAGNESGNILTIIGLLSKAAAGATEIGIENEERNLERQVQDLGFSFEEQQMTYELTNAYRAVLSATEAWMQLTINHQRALQQVNNVIAKGNRILAEREVFRQRAAAIIQGYRTKDLGFRIFRNEALEQYRTLFDLASRYTYLAAKSYDYETGLLGSTEGQTVFAKIVASRSLGDLTGGVPQATTSTLGDAGLAGTMARLDADFSVAKGRLGINNPDQNGTVFSLRAELFRLLDNPNLTSDDEAWQQTLEHYMVANVLADADVATYCMNIKKPDGTPVPGIVLPFSTTIQHGKNFFGLDLAAGDHAYTPSTFATKIYNVGVVLPGYIGMDSYATGGVNGTPASSDPNALSATPYVYLIPCGNDYMLSPPLGDTNTVRTWNVRDQALPLPYNLGATDFNSTQFFNANGTLSEQPWILRKHQAFRPVSDPGLFYSRVPAEFTNSRLIGRSVWNGQWKLVIPAYTLLNNEQDGLNRFVATVKDIQLFLRTYSHSGN